MALLLALHFGGAAQDHVNTLNEFIPQTLNPSSVAMDNLASLGFLYRRVSIMSGLVYSNSVLNVKYPLITKSGKRYGGLGINFLEKDATDSDVLKSTALGITFAYNLNIKTDQFISFGLQGQYNNKRTSLENLTTSNQWIANEFRFDPTADKGEPFTEERIDYLGFNAGITWYKIKEGNPSSFFSIAAQNLNKPNNSFFEENKSPLAINYIANSGIVVYKSDKLQITPQLVYQSENSKELISLILNQKIEFNNLNPYDIISSGSVEIIGKYDMHQDASLALVFNQPNFSLGFSYTFPFSQTPTNTYLQGGTEFGIKFSKSLFNPKPKIVVIESQPMGATRQFNFDQDKKQPTTVQKSDMDIVQDNIKEISEVQAVRFELSKNFNYSFGKTDLDSEAKSYLEEMYTLLKNNPKYKLQVIGHTDNVGRPQVNYKLSSERARVVADYLISIGLESERVAFSGMGDTDPIADNDTEDNKSKNRRVEFIIYVDK